MLTAALAALVLAIVPEQGPPRPRPFPGSAPPPASQPSQPADTAQQPASAQPVDPDTGVALYPGSVLLGKYEAGPGQPFYIYGSNSGYANVVEYYRGVLKDRGRQLFGGPMHQFDLGRFRRDTMTLQPAVTVKDYTWNGRAGYIHATGLETATYPTIIQIVPAPSAR